MSLAPQGTWVSCEVRLPGGRLVIAPLAAFGLGAGAMADRLAAGPHLRVLVAHPEAVARLRGYWLALGLPGVPARLTEREMLAALGHAVTLRRLGIVWLPDLPDPLDRVGADRTPAASPPPAPTGAQSVRDMSRYERMKLTLERVPNYLTGALKEQFKALLTPTSIGLTVGAFVALAVGHFFGYGEAVDAALAVIAYSIAGLAGVRALYNMVAATVNAITATTEADINAAAERMADAFVVLGMAFITAFLTRSARKAAQARAARTAEGEGAADAPRQPRAARAPAARQGAAGAGEEQSAGSIRNVNPTGGTNNCVNCAIATDSTLAGRPASALPGNPTQTSVLERFYGGRFQRMSPDGITSAMQEAGPGSRGIVWGTRGPQVGHVFNVVNQNGTVRFLDGQIGGPASLSGYDTLNLLRTN